MSARNTSPRQARASAQLIDFAGYTGCPVIANDHTRVVLGPHAGGRLLEYSLNGANAIFLDPAQDGWTWQPGKPAINLTGGRLDVGPEMVLPGHPKLWAGPWRAQPARDQRKARMTSVPDDSTGLQLTRDFALAHDSSHLRVIQTIRNVSERTVECYHWSRTLAQPLGVAVVPLTEPSRFPAKYLMYTPDAAMAYRPSDPAIEVRDGFLVIKSLPKYPKLVFDAYAGWFAYLLPGNTLFVKRFRSYPDRVYADMPGTTVCIYYHPDFCELEPIGPRERLKPGKSSSFTEDWWLLDYPAPSGALDLKALALFVDANTKAPE